MTETDVHSLVRGAVDLYTHAAPDLLPRRSNDVGLARVAQAGGMSAIVHRHHYSSTAERAAIARDETGFCVLGAIELGDAVGMNPWAVALALDTGACWVSLPTLSARAFRDVLATTAGSAQHAALTFGSGDLSCLDEHGRLVPSVREVLRLVGEAGAVLGTGYVGFDEAIATMRAAAELGIERIVVTNPRPRFTHEEIAAFAEIPGTAFEATCYTAHRDVGAGSTTALERIVEVIRLVGVDRAVLSSDAGMLDAPDPPELLAWGLTELHERGFTLDELDALVRTNPRRLVPAPAVPEAVNE